MTRYKVTIEYDGTGYVGWQRQKNAPSIQQTIEESLHKLTGEKTEVIGSGRTDSGVHAFGQVAHFDIKKKIDSYKILTGLNHFLNSSQIAILKVEVADKNFSARFNAKKRYYEYKILNRKAPSPILYNKVWYVNVSLSFNAMVEAAKLFEGNHDFSSFRASECQAKSPIKTLDSIKIDQQGDLITFNIVAKSFLHHQCRNIVGTLKEVGEGRRKPSDIPQIIAARNRSNAGITAPAHGLYFKKVDY